MYFCQLKKFDSIKTQFNDKSGEVVKFEKQLISFREKLNEIDKKIKILSLNYICSDELNSRTQNELYICPKSRGFLDVYFNSGYKHKSKFWSLYKL